ncbi:hypothetical protein ARHIZOSPH14_15410 [Agromyces rhizosphaerae]|uniref:HdeD family acid-resistance protein n=1 Tax=Agromyces rhizosphaerae TaxID=88374 RepID=A0A9W6FNT2_9MICO|nr:DUF308 domain-containing protein [Agromyces rhizosphaerae]GLI27299.1 hypothetical protein ARHIZOSPH14_15410 [Agromyces rhizosphaerae]
MTDAAGDARGADRSWIAPLVRSGLALAAAVVITFSQDHSTTFGLLVFGAWALATGLVVGALQLRLEADRSTRTLLTVASVVTVVSGILALTVPAVLPMLYYVISVWAAVTGFIELFAGLRTRGRHPASRDRVAVGAFTAVLAIVFLLLPPDNPVVAVGLFGAYLAMIGVFLGIAAFSIRWAALERESAPEAANDASPEALKDDE